MFVKPFYNSCKFSTDAVRSQYNVGLIEPRSQFHQATAQWLGSRQYICEQFLSSDSILAYLHQSLLQPSQLLQPLLSYFLVTVLCQRLSYRWCLLEACLNSISFTKCILWHNHPMVNYTCSRLTIPNPQSHIFTITVWWLYKTQLSPLNSTADTQSPDHNETVISFPLVIIIVIIITVH